MYINDQPQDLDVAPQNIDGRIVLPLRATTEALEKNIEWSDGLIFISNDLVDLQSPEAVEIAAKMKVKLVDDRKPVSYEKLETPIAKYQKDIFYRKTNYADDNNTQDLYKKAADGAEQKVNLPGNNSLGRSKLVDNELVYTSIINDKSELHAFDLAGGQAKKLCDLDEHSWLGNVKYMNDELYFVIHYGDLTMGSETLYKLENGQPREVAGAKMFASFDIVGDYLYYTDFNPMVGPAENFYRKNLESGQKERVGEQGFTYGVNRTIREGGGVNYSRNPSPYFTEDYLYVLGYQAADREDKGAIFRINLDDLTQERISSPARSFWLIGQKLYYIELETGNLMEMDLDGRNKITVSDKQVIDLQAFKGKLYYTAARNDTAAHEFYQYDLNTNQQVLLTDRSVQNFFVGKTGVYYQTGGYDLGLYKVEADGNSTRLVDDTIESALITDTGMVYTLRYQTGIYTVR